ncbi:Hypothetical predicted protein [Podarcis lilfordi]|uniref:Uncharacterized protein n=1 Tax=Podarcis lilfordi TaxID=74358 RepID=A0AA35PUY4_9SAUR|nr:Hypothetical predicted protein [Podarcis lilfordi]
MEPGCPHGGVQGGAVNKISEEKAQPGSRRIPGGPGAETTASRLTGYDICTAVAAAETPSPQISIDPAPGSLEIW